MTHEQFERIVYSVGLAVSAGLWSPTILDAVNKAEGSVIGILAVAILAFGLSMFTSWLGVGAFFGVLFLGGLGG